MPRPSTTPSSTCTGELDRSYLTALRELRRAPGLPAAAPRIPTSPDFSTGSVGLGAVAPLFAAAARRYVDAHFGARRRRPRFIALVGDAELDEGNVWEAIADPATQGLGNVHVDRRPQPPEPRPGHPRASRPRQLSGFFDDAGWHVVEAKYGRRLAGGVRPARRRRAPGPHRRDVQRGLPVAVRPADGRRAARPSSCAGADRRRTALLAEVPDDDLHGARHRPRRPRPRPCSTRYAPAMPDRPAERRVRLHRQGLGPPDRRRPAQPLRPARHRPRSTPAGSRPGSPPRPSGTASTPTRAAGRLCAAVGRRDQQRPPCRRARLCPSRPASACGHRGKPVVDPGGVRPRPGRARRATRLAAAAVTTPPTWPSRPTSAAGSTRSACSRHASEPDDDGRTALLRWAPSPEGHHLELGICEMNLFLLLPQLGLATTSTASTCSPSARSTTPSSAAASTRSSTASTTARASSSSARPSGVTLAPEGGAHQSHHHPVGRHRAPRPGVCRAGLRQRARLAAVRRPGRLADRRRPRPLPAPVHAPDRSGPV